MKTYDDLKFDALLYHSEARGFCGPLAIAAATGLDIGGIMHYVKNSGLKVSAGNRYGMTMHGIKGLLTDLTGHEPKRVLNSKVKTPITAQRHLDPSKVYLLDVDRHVICVRHGQVIDWTEGRRHRVRAIYEIGGV